MDKLHNHLKIMNRQSGFYMKHKPAMKNNLIGLLNQTYSSDNTYLDSPTHSDDNQKWRDFASTYRHGNFVHKTPFLTTTRNSANKRSTTSVNHKLKESTEKQRDLFPNLYYGRVKEYPSALPKSK